MAKYGIENAPSYFSEDDSDQEDGDGDIRRPVKRKNEDTEEEIYSKKRKIGTGSMPRLSTASSASSYESPSNSEGELSPGFYSGHGNHNMFGVGSSENIETEDSPDQSNFSSKAQKMMMSMGYEKGKGLGKFQQGIVAPVSASSQRGRRGLGFTIDGLEPMENLKWDKSKEHISVKEEVLWLPSNNSTLPDLQTMLSWAKEGLKKEDISDELEFCHPTILHNVLASKSVFDKLSEKELFRARSRCNPFETLGKLFFQNRAALKMSNMDTVFDFMFTKPVDENGKSLVGPEELLYFADVCAAPGGFSEYVLWRRKTISNGFCDAKGFGFTLRENDFKLHDFFAAPSEFFEPHYGVNGNYGDGNIYVPNNISSFRNFVLKSTGGKGVHFMMADGGFSVDGKENIQEILSKQLYLCQFLVALGIVREGGHFVCKLFDIFTPFSVGLLYIMYKCFKQISLHKPNSSRPANSERYIICKWKKDDVSDAYEYLYKINLRLNSFGTTTDEDVIEVVPLEILKNDEEFYQYIYDLNNIYGERQIISLQKIRVFCQDPSLFEDQQSTLRKECLAYWQLPDKTRVAPERKDHTSKARELLPPQFLEQMTQPPGELLLSNLHEKIRSPYDFRFVFLSSAKDVDCKERGFLLGLGGPNVFIWNGREPIMWKRVTSSMNFPPDTLIYGEIVTELRGEMKAQKRVKTLHCIDGLVLNGFDVTNMHLVERHHYLKKFADAINKESRNDLLPVRCKNMYKLEEIESVIKPPLLEWRTLKGASNTERKVLREAEAFEDDPARYTIPSGILMLKTTRDPWMMAHSKSQRRKYWFNTLTRESTYECMKEVIAPLNVSYCQGAFWWWQTGIQIFENEIDEPGKLHLSMLISHINKQK